MNPLRQGDVLLIPAPTEKVDNKQKLPHLILAEGEVTGHKHRIADGSAELYEEKGTLYLRVLSPTALLIHEEHNQIQVPHGLWLVRIQREYEPSGWRHVED